MTDIGKAKPNRLIDEKSPYLLQHAYNPVDWHPWGEEAFEKARREDRPVFLSVGYSTCHWCHVMEKESFEDPEVARLMNDAFVSIKVDREERPDIDDTYMTVCQMMTGSGGWPLTVIMTPEGVPFFAATYIPKTSRFNRIGMVQLIPHIKDFWLNQRDKTEEVAKKVLDALGGLGDAGEKIDLGEEMLRGAHEQLTRNFDEQNGGFGGAPKFPTPHNLTFLLRYYSRTKDGGALNMVTKTLDAMAAGGIYDQVGFGFHRYSTDARWVLPHFEKMLYDQAMLVTAYLDGYQAAGKKEYADTAKEVLAYVLRDLTSPEGGFYCAEDADSEGEEGKFYVWTQDELRSILAREDFDLASALFNVKEEGNFRDEATGELTGQNVLYPGTTLGDAAQSAGLPLPELKERLSDILEKLYMEREDRVRPLLDDKVLTNWNGLMIAAFAQAARVLGEPSYAHAAKAAAEFILTRLYRDDGSFLHRFREGEAAIPGFLDDYAFLVFGLIELYETTFEPRFLKRAVELNDYLLSHFLDRERGGFFFTADYAREVLVRKKDLYDGAIPSGNSVAMLNLIKLARLTGDSKLEAGAMELAAAFSGQVARAPWAYTQFLCALDFALGPACEVVIVGDPAGEDTKAMIRALHREFLPNKTVIVKPDGEAASEIVELAPFIATHEKIDGKAAAYVCIGGDCKLPVTAPGEMLELIRGGK